MFPAQSAQEPPPRHRKAASLGTAGLSSSFNNFAPHLGSMMEDVEEHNGGYEEGEIAENVYSTQGHHPRSQSQNFTAPRFAALAAQQQEQQHQQQQGDALGPSGRPQLAPNFMFGARRRTSSNSPMGPAISEEDANFQFPQQLQQPNFQNFGEQDQGHRRTESGGEIRGIMAEQVAYHSYFFRKYMWLTMSSQIAIQNEIENLQRQQQALYQQQLASNQVMSFQTPGLVPNRAAAHRRVHSTVPMGMNTGAMGSIGSQQGLMGQLGLGNVNLGLDGQPQGLPRGHGRRHSVNVVNKSGGQPGMGSISFNGLPDGFEDGFAPPPGFGGHSRQASRADSSWRLSTCSIHFTCRETH